jgi:ATP-binding cassette subfamily B protein
VNFSKHRFKVFDFIKLPFIVSPINAMFKIADMIVSAIVPSILTLITARFIDVAIGVQARTYPFSNIYMPIALLFVFVVYQNISKVLFRFFDIKLSFKMNEYIQNQIIYKRATLDYIHIENSDDWELINRACNNPSSQLLDGYNNLLQMIRLIVSLVSYAGILFSQVWWSAIVVIAFTVPLFFLSLKSGKNNYVGYQKAAKYQRRADYLNGVLEDRQYTEERSLFSYSDKIEERWAEQYETSRKITLGVQAKELLKTKGAGLLTVIVSFVFAGMLLIPLKQSIISIGFFIAIVTALFNVVNIVSWELTSISNLLASKLEYLKDLSDFFALSSKENSECLPDVSIREQIDSTVEFKNVSFAYPGTTRLILKDISFKLNMNRKYAFVGLNGAGKTTIIKLLTGLYKDYNGTILVGGRDIKTLKEAEMKALFSVIYQDFAKYQISVLDNICLGSIGNCSDESVESVVKTIGISDLIAQLPDGLNTNIGKIYENSIDISGGEWQRIAMARTLISGAPIYILDEPTASLDPVAESQLYNNFQEVMDDKHLSILITHRLGAVRFTDEILVIEDGTVIERGTHEELVLQKGVYSKMFEEQKGWYEYEE